MREPSFYRARNFLFDHLIEKMPVDAKKNSPRELLKQGYWSDELGVQVDEVTGHLKHIMNHPFVPTNGRYDDYQMQISDQKTAIMGNNPLKLSEITRFSTWFAMHPEKVAGKEKVTTSLFFPVKIEGTSDDVIRVIKNGMGNQKPDQNNSARFQYGDTVSYKRYSTTYLAVYLRPGKEEGCSFILDSGSSNGKWIEDSALQLHYPKEVIETQNPITFSEIEQLTEAGYLKKDSWYFRDGELFLKDAFWRTGSKTQRDAYYLFAQALKSKFEHDYSPKWIDNGSNWLISGNIEIAKKEWTRIERIQSMKMDADIDTSYFTNQSEPTAKPVSLLRMKMKAKALKLKLRMLESSPAPISIKPRSDSEIVTRLNTDLQKEYNFYNKLCFDNKLQNVPLEWNMNKGKLGFVMARGNKFNLASYIVLKLSISLFNQIDYKSFVDTLVHEMIHVYIITNHIKDTGSHGIVFHREMDRINRMNLGITITITGDTSGFEISDTIRAKEFVVVLNYKDTKPSGITIFNRNLYQDIPRWYEAVKKRTTGYDFKYILSNDPNLQKYPALNSFKTNGLKMLRVTDELFKKLEASKPLDGIKLEEYETITIY
jgi:hypothetical protein